MEVTYINTLANNDPLVRAFNRCVEREKLYREKIAAAKAKVILVFYCSECEKMAKG